MINIFNATNNFKSKHIVLKNLFIKWQTGEDKTNGGHLVNDFGRCLSILDLMSKTNLSKNKVDLIVIYFSNKGLIKIQQLDSDKAQKNHKWIITDLGKEFYANNYFLNERALFYRKLFVELLSLIIAFGSLFFSIWTASQNSSLEKQVEQQKQELQLLKHKLLK